MRNDIQLTSLRVPGTKTCASEFVQRGVNASVFCLNQVYVGAHTSVGILQYSLGILRYSLNTSVFTWNTSVFTLRILQYLPPPTLQYSVFTPLCARPSANSERESDRVAFGSENDLLCVAPASRAAVRSESRAVGQPTIGSPI